MEERIKGKGRGLSFGGISLNDKRWMLLMGMDERTMFRRSVLMMVKRKEANFPVVLNGR
jgi:hypothetical protein